MPNISIQQSKLDQKIQVVTDLVYNFKVGICDPNEMFENRKLFGIRVFKREI